MRALAKGLAAAALAASAAVAGAPPAAAVDGSCTATYQLTTVWAGSPFQAVITVRNTGGVAIRGWAVSWIYQDRQTVTSVVNAVPLPTIALLGAYAFGNTPANGNLVPGGATAFYITGNAAGFPSTPSPVNCTPR